MKDETLSFKDLIFAIQAMRKQAMTFLNIDKPYNKLLEIILTKNYYDENEDHSFSGKELQSLTGLSQQKIKIFLEQIHHDIFDKAFDDTQLFNFQNVIYDFYVKGWKKSITFKGFIPVLPRIGDYCEFPFLKAINQGMNRFYVSNIQHQFTDTTQYIVLWLDSGIYNSYTKFKEDKDNFERHEQWLKTLKNKSDYT
jgi:hypothetical protein